MGKRYQLVKNKEQQNWQTERTNNTGPLTHSMVCFYNTYIRPTFKKRNCFS